MADAEDPAGSGPAGLAGAAAPVVGRTREVELLVAALDAGAHVVLEGPPGTGKSTLLRAVADDAATPFVFVEGNAELTPARLVGHFDPAQVLESGYVPATFVDGPLVQALRSGALLYVEEVNRIPEETLNVLITVMSEGELHVPRLGRVKASKDFRLVAAMNPFDAVGTARISSSVYDRVCRIAMGYQSAADETAVVGLRAPRVEDGWRARVVALVRRTREHPDVRVGSSVRGAIDMVRIAEALARRRRVAETDWRVGLDAALVALSGRIRLKESAPREAEDVVRELYETEFGPEHPAEDRSPADGDAPGGSLSPPPAGVPDPGGRPDRPRSRPGDRTVSRVDLARQRGFAEISPQVGVLDVEAFDSSLAERPDETLALLADMARATDESLRAAARRLAARVVLDPGRSGRARRRGVGSLRTEPADRDGDLDLDASLAAVADARATRRPLRRDELTVRTWARPTLALCLLVDASGSMGGARLAAAALTAAACAWRAPGDHAVLAFAREVRVLRAMDSERPTAEVVDTVLGLRGHGVTALAGALRSAADQLARSRASRRVVVLLSDCRATDDEDPRPPAVLLPELLVLAPAEDCEQAAAFAAEAGARWAPIAGPADAPGALQDLMDRS